MAIAVDTVSSATGEGTGPFTFSHTTSGSNRLMVIGVSYFHNSSYITALTYNGVSLTQITGAGSATGDYHVVGYYLVAPATGSNTVSLTMAAPGAYDLGLGVITLTGVDQVTPFGTAMQGSGSDTTPTVDVPSGTDELVFDATIIVHSGTYTVGAGQTSRWNAIASGGYIKYSGSTEPGAGPATLSWSNTTPQPWATFAVPIKPVAAVGGSAVPVFMSHRRNQGMS